jgi:hypothetical protein
MKSLLAAAAILAAALSFEVLHAHGEADAHVAPAAPSHVPTCRSAREPCRPSHATPRPRAARARARRGARATYTRSAARRAQRRPRDAYCIDCHSNDLKLGNLSLEGFDIAHADTARLKAEKMIRKLRAEMMPLAGRPRPPSDTLQMVANAHRARDRQGSTPNAGSRTFQRLNRPEYENAVRDLLGVEVNAPTTCPLDTKSANFDNIADAQLLSPTLLEAYLQRGGDGEPPGGRRQERAALDDDVPRVAVHLAAPWDHVDGAPYGTRGGIVAHTRSSPTASTSSRSTSRAASARGSRTSTSRSTVRASRSCTYERGVNKSFSMQDLPLGVDLYKTDAADGDAPARTACRSRSCRRGDGPYEDPHQAARLVARVRRLGELRHDDAAAHHGSRHRRAAERGGRFRDAEPAHHLLVSSVRHARRHHVRAQILNRLGTRAYRER